MSYYGNYFKDSLRSEILSEYKQYEWNGEECGSKATAFLRDIMEVVTGVAESLQYYGE